VGETIHQEDFMSLLSNLASGSKNAVAFKNLIAYYDKYDERADKVGQGEAKPPQTKLYVHAFTQDFDAGVFWTGQGTKSAWDNAPTKAYFLNYTKDAVTTTGENSDLVLNTGRSILAKVVIKTGVATKGTRKLSTRTKLPYLDYAGTSASIPFGRQNDSDQELAVFNAIVGRAKGTGSALPSGMRLSRIKEKF
jgi:hypothetical protein